MRKKTHARNTLRLIDVSQHSSALNLFKTRLHDQNLKDKTITNYASDLTIFFAWVVLYSGKEKLEDLTYDDYRGFLKYLDQDSLAPRTVNVYIATLKKFHYFVRGMSWNHYEIPFRKYDSTLPVVPSVSDAALMVATCTDTFDKALIMLLLSTGIRISEACALTYEDIHRDKMEIHVRPGKSRADRNVPLDDSVLSAVEEHCRKMMVVRSQRGLPAIVKETPIFLFKDAITPANTNLLRRHFKKVVAAAGLEHAGYNPHSCRHFFALNVYLQHFDLALVKNLLGHKTLNATEVYLRLAASRIMLEKGYTNPLQLCLKAGGAH